MRQYIEIGPCPADEECAQVGDIDYSERSRKECSRFIDLIRSRIGLEPEGALLATKSFAHDYGSYREVVCYYDDSNEEAIRYAFKVESESPTTWEE